MNSTVEFRHLGSVEDGVDLITRAVQDGSAVDCWTEGSLQAFLSGHSVGPVVQKTWTLEQFALFDWYKLPCWVLRCASPTHTLRLADELGIA